MLTQPDNGASFTLLSCEIKYQARFLDLTITGSFASRELTISLLWLACWNRLDFFTNCPALSLSSARVPALKKHKDNGNKIK